MKKNESINHYWDTIEITIDDEQVSYPILVTKFAGNPSISEIRQYIKDLNEETKEVKQDYLSATDFKDITLNKFLESFIIYGMEATIKGLLKVKNKAKISFLILGASPKWKNLENTLKRINDEDSGDYKYSYVAINDVDEIEEKAAEILTNKH